MPDTHDTREKKQEIQTPRQPEPGEVLRARAAKGKIDHRSLTRQIIARFPKILAALAK